MIASRPTGSFIRRIIDCGARGFLHKDDASMDGILIEAIQGIRKGSLYLSRRANQLMTAQHTLPERMQERDIDVGSGEKRGYG
jgi:DNA-binding NarL/FixJ family response regulator